MRYYDLKRHWTKKIIPHLGDEELNRVLVRDFNRYTFGRWHEPFKPGMYPEDFESCNWRDYSRPFCDGDDDFRRGPMPRYWSYVKHAACHWIVNFALRLATLAEPRRCWRIISSDFHSTVWDGEATLFDFNYQALGIDADECFRAADGRHLRQGKYLGTYYAQHYSIEQLAAVQAG